MSNSLRDIALKAGVTTGTVSRALGNKPGVSEKRRQEILAIAEEMHYVPNIQASSLRTGKRSGMTIISPQFGYNSIGALRNSRLLEKGMKEFGSANIRISTDISSFHKTIQSVLAENCRYLVLSGVSDAFLTDKTVSLLQGSASNVLLMDSGTASFDSVDIYRENGMYQAVRLLILNRCENIYFYNNSSIDKPNDRLRGAIAAYKSLGKPLSGINIITWNEEQFLREDSFTVGYNLTRYLLSSKNIDGLFCSNDELAIGALCAIREKGVSVPEDIKVLGFDNIPESKYTAPPLTTVAQPVEEMTDAVIELCRFRDENKNAPLRNVKFPTNLIVRESTPFSEPGLRNKVFMDLD